jgi:hypothetical protein
VTKRAFSTISLGRTVPDGAGASSLGLASLATSSLSSAVSGSTWGIVVVGDRDGDT